MRGVAVETERATTTQVLPKRAMKYVEDIEDVKRETGIFQHVGNHPNIVQLYGAYEDSRNVYLVQELCRGGDLIDAVIEKGRFSEADAARAVADILSVLVHMHSLGVCHRDIKPDNFVWADKECTRVKGACVRAKARRCRLCFAMSRVAIDPGTAHGKETDAPTP